MCSERKSLLSLPPSRSTPHFSIFYLCFAHLLCHSAAGELSIGIRGAPCQRTLAKKSLVLPPLSFRPRNRQTQSERNFSLNRGCTVAILKSLFTFIFCYTPWTHYLTRSKYTLMQRLIRASGFLPWRKVSRSGWGTNSREFLASGLRIVLSYENNLWIFLSFIWIGYWPCKAMADLLQPPVSWVFTVIFNIATCTS